MKTELLNIFDANGVHLGISSRDEVHQKGYWHKTFHCWIISEEEGRYYIHFQVRSDNKQDYPGLFDISAAGHLLADEEVAHGIREVREELGISLSLEELISLGTIPDEIIQNDMIDKELAHVFMYVIPPRLDIKYDFQIEEVSGIVKIDVNDFAKFWKEEVHTITVKEVIGIEQNHLRNTRSNVQKKDFLPHNDSYMMSVIEAMNKHL